MERHRAAEKGRRKKRGADFKTFTKQWVSRLMYIAVADIQLSYILAFFGKEQIAETLSVTVVTEIIGVMACYFAKSFFETKEAEKNRLKEKERAAAWQQEGEEAWTK